VSFNQRVTISSINNKDIFAFGFNVSALPTMATTTIQQTTIGTTMLGRSTEMHQMFTSLRMGGWPNGERGDGLEAGGSSPPSRNPG